MLFDLNNLATAVTVAESEEDMTNAMIIFNNSVELMEQGIIGTTGRTVVVEDQNGKNLDIKYKKVKRR